MIIPAAECQIVTFFMWEEGITYLYLDGGDQWHGSHHIHTCLAFVDLTYLAPAYFCSAVGCSMSNMHGMPQISPNISYSNACPLKEVNVILCHHNVRPYVLVTNAPTHAARG